MIEARDASPKRLYLRHVSAQVKALYGSRTLSMARAQAKIAVQEGKGLEFVSTLVQHTSPLSAILRWVQACRRATTGSEY